MAKTPDFAQTITAAMNAPAVRAALRAKAERILPRAQRLAYQAGAAGLAEALHIEEGTRPGSKAGGFQRPFARVIADVTDDLIEQDRGAKMTRKSIVRRSAGA